MINLQQRLYINKETSIIHFSFKGWKDYTDGKNNHSHLILNVSERLWLTTLTHAQNCLKGTRITVSGRS